MLNPRLPKIWYGGDYNPEQWDPSVMEEDVRMFKVAGIDVATVNVFSWAKLQPDEETYRFEELDNVMDRLYRDGIYVCLATSTGAHPAWMARKYPDVLRVDHMGRKRKFGGRHNSCPNSPTYRLYSARLAEKLAERYAGHPGLLLWHVSNEYGGYCYCDLCAAAFRAWLRERYQDLDTLNRMWYTSFWGHTFYDWDEIVPPNELSEEWGRSRSTFQTISLDYRRFQSDSLLACYRLEYSELKKYTPDIAVTTNMMGTYPELDYFRWAPYLDVISWDNYPSHNTPFSFTAMTHDLMRGLKGGQPFMLMEQTPSQQNWQPYNALKRPGVMRLWSYQAVARGADTVMFFQLRRSIGACEKFHGAVIEHVGHEHTRVFQECAELGRELQGLADRLLDARVEAKAAVVFDWENRWAVELSSGPSVDLKYVDEVHKYYDALYQLHIQTNMIGVEEDFARYELIIAPVLYMLKPGVAEKIRRFVERGGIFVTTFFSGIVNEQDIVTVGGYPGELRSLLGIWVEEIDALPPGQMNELVLTERGQPSELKRQRYSCGLLCDLIHSEGAEVAAVYGTDFYQGMPAVTVNRYGKGQAWYVGSSPEPEFMQGLLANLCAEKGIAPVLDAPSGVEVTQRSKAGKTYTFILNHRAEAVEVTLPDSPMTELLTGVSCSRVLRVEGRGVAILESGPSFDRF
ncbi:beta-galactosidase [Paenibacillus turpanensis]|uniref:beta-galactosidase n=1 Tax=Paenibacillus turpanensis TaxID=2689078 RepID=UPI00140B6E5D|nr:beta-galactosidase [Paenibacillus turpanensis]